MDAQATVLRMHAYKSWIRTSLLDTMQSMQPEDLNRTFEIGMGSLWESAVHMYGAERGWLATLAENPDHDFELSESLSDLEGLRELWESLDATWMDFINKQSGDDWERVIVRESKIRSMTYRFTVFDVAIHVCTHAVHTIAQCRNMMRSCGVESLPLNDFIFFADDSLKSTQTTIGNG